MIDSMHRILDRAIGRPPSIRVLTVATALGGIGVGCSFGLRSTGDLQVWSLVAIAFVVGFGLSSAIHWMRVGRPLSVSRKVAEHVESGNLSETFPRSGSRDLRVVNRLLNSILADFQEVLLLFAQLTSEALEAVDHSEAEAEPAVPDDDHRRESVRRALIQMRAVVEDFTFFGVQIRGDTISDVNIERSHGFGTHQAGDPSASVAPDTKIPNGRMFERDAHHE